MTVWKAMEQRAMEQPVMEQPAMEQPAMEQTAMERAARVMAPPAMVNEPQAGLRYPAWALMCRPLQTTPAYSCTNVSIEAWTLLTVWALVSLGLVVGTCLGFQTARCTVGGYQHGRAGELYKYSKRHTMHPGNIVLSRRL